MSEQQQDPNSPDTLANLRAAADEGRKLKRENVMLKAGVDVSTPLGKMFAENGYTGELEVDAVKAAWSEIAPAPAPPAPVPPETGAPDPAQAQAEADERARQDAARRGIATGTQEPAPTPVPDALAAAKEQAQANLEAGMGREKAAKPVFDAILKGAVEGDQRFVFNGWTEQELAEGRTSRA